jgi:hypothetical protein
MAIAVTGLIFPYVLRNISVVRVLILDEALLKNKRKGLEDHRVDADAFIDPYEALRHLSKRHAATA